MVATWAAPEEIAVLDVVVDQAVVVDQLEGGGKGDGAVVPGPGPTVLHQGALVAEQRHRGAEPLSSSGPLGRRQRDEVGVGPAEVIADDPPQPGVPDLGLEHPSDLRVDPRGAGCQVVLKAGGVPGRLICRPCPCAHPSASRS